MLRIALKKAKPGMLLARHIYGPGGKVLLAAGIKLEKRYLQRLKELGISSIYICDRFTDGITVTENISEETRLRAESAVNKVFKETNENQKMDTNSIIQMTEGIIEEVLTNNNALINLADVRAYDNYTFAHSVNVCVLSIITGVSLGLNHFQLRDLGIGALLHDIGKTKIDPKLLNKAEQLNHHDYEIIKEHPTIGFEILRQVREISLVSSHVAYQHHERLDGSGYPRGLKEKQIHLFGMICAVADIYDALISDRPYRLGLLPHQALDIITLQAKINLNPEIVAAFIQNVAPYPVNTPVQLNTGEIGIIFDVNKKFRHRPVVRLIFDAHFKELKNYKEIDLSMHSDTYIVKALSPNDFPTSHLFLINRSGENSFSEASAPKNQAVKNSLV